MDGSNSRNFTLLVLLGIILVGLFGYSIFTNFTEQQPVYTDLSSLVGD